MPIKRKSKNGTTYLYWTEEYYDPVTERNKKREKPLGVEEPPKAVNMTEEFAVVWASNRTLGNAVPFSDRVTGQFPPEKEGKGVILPCDIVECGKFRNGKQRWWCRTHQVHWGTKADIEQATVSELGIRCSNSTQPMDYAKEPLVLNPEDYSGGIGVWAALPTAINTTSEPDIETTAIHVHARLEPRGKKSIDGNHLAIVIAANEHLPLFNNVSIKRVVIAPPAALAYLEAVVDGLKLDTLYCNKCNHPHLDLGSFAKRTHKKHFCGNCGVDSNWSKEPIVSSPLKELSDRFNPNPRFSASDRKLDLRDYSDCQFKVWASTPAILWTSELAQETGIHVHIYQKSQKIVDDTFGEVIWLDGSTLERNKLLKTMLDKAEV